MTELVLYHAVPSRSLTVRWMLEELGVPFTIKLINLQLEQHKTPEFLALNSMGRVPVLQHGDVVVTETAAILLYLSEVFADAGLGVAVDDPRRAAFLRWMFFCPVSAEPAVFWEVLGDAVKSLPYQPFADVESVARMLDAALGDKPFIMGDTFTVADVMVGSTIMWGTQLMPVLPASESLRNYWARLEQRPGWQVVKAEMQAATA